MLNKRTTIINRKDGFYWARFRVNKIIEVIEFFEGHWWITGADGIHDDEFDWFSDTMLIPPDNIFGE